ncbi:DNA internalization-related competence protein ComEC/Rec2 [Halomonas organivorans]
MPLALAALGGVLSGHLVSATWLQGLGLVLLVALAVRRWQGVLLLGVFLAATLQVLLLKGDELALGLARQDLVLEGRLVAVSRETRLARLTLEVERCRPRSPGLPACEGLSRIRLSAYDPPTLAVGERWRLAARLRPPSGFANPGAFDYRAWLWREGIQATGYVRDDPPPRKLADAPFSLRRAALDHLEDQALSPRPRRWLAALTLGAGERLTADDWALLNASGTTHLMVISGLHVGLVAGFALWLARGLARGLAPGGWRMAVWPWWAAGVSAAAYAGLAGLEPPAARATIMVVVGLWAASGRHAPGPWQAWWLAMALVVLAAPLSVWRPGFWLSFAAVAWLILIWQGRPRPRGAPGWAWALVRTQLLLAPPMAGAVLLGFDRLAPVAPLVNLVAVPLVGSLMVPLGLAGWALAWAPPLSGACWALFAWLGEILASLLAVATDLLPLWQPDPAMVLPLALALAALGLGWGLPGLDIRLRWAATPLLAALPLWPSPAVPGPGELRVRVHDVGQGQLIELRTASYRALIDTGPRFASGFMPLTTLWPPGQEFDDVIVSHGDRDHAGGLEGLLDHHRVGRFLAPPEDALPVAAEPCVAGRRWRRDGVAFRLLWPPAGMRGLSDNDRSCVLLIRVGDHALLVTGDAGARVEATLLKRLEGPVSVLVAGHHGSRTSSTPRFVQRLRPRHVIFSAGRGNRFGHPAPEVVRRFRRQGSCLWNTARDGALTLWLGRGVGEGPQAARRPPGVGDDCLALESPPSMPEARR